MKLISYGISVSAENCIRFKIRQSPMKQDKVLQLSKYNNIGLSHCDPTRSFWSWHVLIIPRASIQVKIADPLYFGESI